MRALDAIDARMLPLDIPEHGEILSVEWLAEGGSFQFSTACIAASDGAWVG